MAFQQPSADSSKAQKSAPPVQPAVLLVLL
jgi:hypothetical protein